MAQAALQAYLSETNMEQEPSAVIGGLEFYVPLAGEYQQIFTPQACLFVRDLIRQFGPKLRVILQDRRDRQQQIDRGRLPGFRPETLAIRDADWQIRDIPNDLRNRAVEISVGTDRGSLLNALNSLANVVSVDFEDACSANWQNIAQGQINLHEAVEGSLSNFDSELQRFDRLQNPSAVLVCRPRALHAQEKHIRMNGVAVPACLVDFGFFFYHNVLPLLRKGSAPYFYIAKLETANEAAWWADVFYVAEQKFALAAGTIKATIAIETLPAVFETDEILYALREHAVALCSNRSNYLFSYIKTLRNYPISLLPDELSLDRDAEFLQRYVQRLVQSCKRRGAMAIGDLVTYLPGEAKQSSQHCLNKLSVAIASDVAAGFAGSRIVHPEFVAAVREHYPEKQTSSLESGLAAKAGESQTAEALMTAPQGLVHESRIRGNIRDVLRYLEAWLMGAGTVALAQRRQDLATSELAAALVWQWLHYSQKLNNGKVVTRSFIKDCIEEELVNLRLELGNERFECGRFDEAARLLESYMLNDTLTESLSKGAYEIL